MSNATEDRLRQIEQRLTQIEGQLAYAADAVRELRTTKIDGNAVVDLTAHLEEDSHDANRAIGALEAEVENMKSDGVTQKMLEKVVTAASLTAVGEVTKSIPRDWKKRVHTITRDPKTHRVVSIRTTEE